MAEYKRINNFDEVVTKLIAKAEAALSKEADNYEAVLAECLNALRQALDEKNNSDAIRIVYSIKGVAGTLGWPLVSTAAGYFRHVLEEQGKIKKIDETISVHMHTLELLFKNQMKGEHPEGIKLIKNLHNLLLKHNINPS